MTKVTKPIAGVKGLRAKSYNQLFDIQKLSDEDWKRMQLDHKKQVELLNSLESRFNL